MFLPVSTPNPTAVPPVAFLGSPGKPTPRPPDFCFLLPCCEPWRCGRRAGAILNLPGHEWALEMIRNGHRPLRSPSIPWGQHQGVWELWAQNKEMNERRKMEQCGPTRPWPSLDVLAQGLGSQLWSRGGCQHGTASPGESQQLPANFP